MTNLKDKAIDIKGKKYVLVSDRILFFNETYPQGSIMTELVSKPEDDMVVVKATIKPEKDGIRAFTGYSQATWDDGYINKTSALENAETSAVGRALAFMGIGVIDSVASVDEINKTTHPRPVKLSPNEALENARTAIEECKDLDALTVVDKRVRISKNIKDEDKAMLRILIENKRQTFDPTA